MLINSADLMGGSSEPDGLRGFGRVYLEAGMPLEGSGDTALFVVDAAERSIDENAADEYSFTLNSNTSLEFRATLAWIDPAATVTSTVQLIHDLDLTVVSPSGTVYQMWSFGADMWNVVERVIVSADDVDSDNAGEWTVSVSAGSLTTSSQPYSLVVTGPIAEGSEKLTTTESSAAPRTANLVGMARVLTMTATLTSAIAAAVWMM